MPSAKYRNKPGRLATGRANKREEAVLNKGGVRVETYLYNYSVDGGAVGTYESNRFIPAGALVTALRLDVQTAVTGADAVTIKVGSQALTAALDLTALATGIHSAALTDADGVKIASEGELNIAVATNAATAGKFRIYVQYFVPQD